MPSISRNNSSSSIVNLATPIASPGTSSPKQPSVTRSSSSASFSSDKAEFSKSKGKDKAEQNELPANVDATPVKPNWRTSLESKIKGGIDVIKSFAAKGTAKLTETYDFCKELLHEVGMFFANLGTTLTGLARPQAQAQVPAQAPVQAEAEETVVAPATPKSPVFAPVVLGAVIEPTHKDVN